MTVVIKLEIYPIHILFGVFCLIVTFLFLSLELDKEAQALLALLSTISKPVVGIH